MRRKVWLLAFTFVFIFWAIFNLGLAIDLEKRFFGVRKEAQIVSKTAPEIYVMGFKDINGAGVETEVEISKSHYNSYKFGDTLVIYSKHGQRSAVLENIHWWPSYRNTWISFLWFFFSILGFFAILKFLELRDLGRFKRISGHMHPELYDLSIGSNPFPLPQVIPAEYDNWIRNLAKSFLTGGKSLVSEKMQSLQRQQATLQGKEFIFTQDGMKVASYLANKWTAILTFESPPEEVADQEGYFFFPWSSIKGVWLFRSNGNNGVVYYYELLTARGVFIIHRNLIRQHTGCFLATLKNKCGLLKGTRGFLDI